MSLARLLIPMLILMLPSVGWSTTLVLSPMFPGNVDRKTITNVHQLIEAELEFAPGLEQVKGLETRPSVLGPNCLQTPTCLGGLARAFGGDLFLGGILTSKDSNYVLDLVLYDANQMKIIRRKNWTVPRDPTELANGITPILAEILTGKNPNEEDTISAVASEFGDDSLEDEEELDFEAGSLVAPVAVTPKKAPVPKPASTTSVNSISFGGSVSDITTEDLAQVQFGAFPTPEPENDDPTVGGTAGGAYGGGVGPVASADPVIDTSLDLDGLSYQNRPVKVKSPVRSTAGAAPSVSVRAGYASYYKLNFVTVGAEGSYPITQQIHAIAGVESYLVRRTLTSDIQPVGLADNQAGPVMYQWESILPFNFGAVYRLDMGNLTPYGGIDVITAQYFKNTAGADWAVGVRARVGVDVPISSLLSLNINGAMGIWSGPTWAYIEQGVANSGPIPQISAGTTIPF